MHFTILREDLLSLVSKIQNIVPAKPSIPILSSVLLEAKLGLLTLSATDLNLSIRADTKANIKEEGALAVPARHLFQLIRELTSSLIEMKVESGHLILIAGASHFKIPALKASEFPSFPDLSEGLSFAIPGGDLKEALSRSSFAAAGLDDRRPMLNTLSLACSGKIATFLSTDGKRLAKIVTPLGLSQEHSSSYAIPLRIVSEMIHLLDKVQEEAKITLSHDKIALEWRSLLLIGKLSSGEYPDVAKIIPQKQKEPVELDKEELTRALKQIALFTEQKTSSVRFKFSPGFLSLSANSSELGEGKTELPIQYAGSPLEIAFNPIYFLDILRHVKDDTIHFNVTDPYNPGLITDSSSAEFVIMPMRLEKG